MKKCDILVYLAHAMSGRSWDDVRRESKKVKSLLRKYGICVIDPIDIENDSVSSSVEGDKSSIPNRPDAGGKKAWYGDKKAIRKAHVVLDITPEFKSEGVLRELGYARFYLWKPVVRVYRSESKPHMITIFEDDAVARSIEGAAKLIKRRWGTKEKRIKWRRAMLERCLPNFIEHQLEEFK